MKAAQNFIALAFLITSLAATSQTDSIAPLPASVELVFSVGPTFMLESDAGGLDPYIYPTLLHDRNVRAAIVFNRNLSYKLGYEYHGMVVDYGLANPYLELHGASTFNLLHAHAVSFDLGQSYFVSTNGKKGDNALVITPWVGVRTAFVQPFQLSNHSISNDALDTTFSNFAASTSQNLTDSTGSIFLQRTSIDRKTSLNLMFSVSFEIRILERLHFGLQPFYSQGLGKLYSQEVHYLLQDEGVSGQHELTSQGSHYGLLFSLRVKLFEKDRT